MTSALARRAQGGTDPKPPVKPLVLPPPPQCGRNCQGWAGWGAGSCPGVGPSPLCSPEAGREGLNLPRHKSQATWRGGGTLGRAGKPQFITKMENDTSLHTPQEGG